MLAFSGRATYLWASVKARDLVSLLGWRPKPRTFGSDIRTFELPRDGQVQYAQWRHPGERPKIIRQEVVDELRRFIRPGDVAIDIGAHTGDSTIPMALAAGPSGRVLALEPNPYVFEVLDRNAGLNAGKTSIIPMNVAATAKSGPIEFEYSDSGFCNGGRHEGISRWRHGHAFALTVQGVDLEAYLDAYLPDLVPRVRYVKIDAEGYDLTVLESIAGLITRTRPFIRAEVFKLTTPAHRARFHQFFAGRDYDVLHLTSETDYRGPLLTAADMTRWPHFDVLGVPRGI
jgi:FkbM family methyltransferase